MNPRRWLLGHAPGLFARWCEPDAHELGQLGEEFAARHVRDAGWQLLGRRVRTRAGEIDLLALDGGELVCVEVKTSRAQQVPRPRGMPAELARICDEPGERLAAPQLARLAHSVRLLARERGLAPERTRIDLIEVVLEERPARVEVRHHRDWPRAWSRAREKR